MLSSSSKNNQIENSDSTKEIDEEEVRISLVSMEKKISLVSSTLLLAGCIIGTGIFMTPNDVVSAVPSVFYSLMIWVFCGVISLFAALCYAELGSKFPSLGGEYTYFREIYHESVSFAYLFSNFFLIRPVCISILVIFLSKILLSLFYGKIDPSDYTVSIKLISIFFMIVICTLNCLSERLTILVNDVLTYSKFVCMGVVIVLAGIKIGKGETQYITDPGFNVSLSPTKVSEAIYNGMWAFDGFNTLGYVVNKMANPQRNLILANVFGMLSVVVFYLLINVSYIILIGVPELTKISDVVLAAVDPFFGKWSKIISILVGLSSFSTASATSYSGGNLYFDAGHCGHFPLILGAYHKKFKTFIPALICQTAVTIFYICCTIETDKLIAYFSSTSWIFYSLVFLGCIVARYSPSIRKKVHENQTSTVQLFILIPVLTFCVSFCVIILGFLDKWINAVVSLSIIIGAFPVYFIFVYKGGILPEVFKQKITKLTYRCFEKLNLTNQN